MDLFKCFLVNLQVDIPVLQDDNTGVTHVSSHGSQESILRIFWRKYLKLLSFCSVFQDISVCLDH